ncbi:MAG TPA: hypothetical protein VGH27_29885 [Streptosporangiaceae bacterium]|jgi:hypothetical protein
MSVGMAFLMALGIVVCLAAFIFIVMWANRHPNVKNRKPRKPHQKVTGGIHQGDPRSVAPHRDEVVPPPREDSAACDETPAPRRR